MLKLLYKEFRLCVHPTFYIFILMGILILIPNYPYCVVFLFGCLAPFITLYNARENHDAFYTAFLPVKKSDVVKSKFLLFVVAQCTQMILSLPFAYLRITKYTETNIVGMEPNLAYYGFGLIIFTLFNVLFFTEFYKNAYKVGKAFLFGIIPSLVVSCIVEGFTYIPAFAWLEQQDAVSSSYRLFLFIAGCMLYIVANMLAYRVAKHRFENVDL